MGRPYVGTRTESDGRHEPPPDAPAGHTPAADDDEAAHDTMLRYRVTSLWRTLTEPWRPPGLIVGVIGAFTIGTALVTSGALYSEAAVIRVAAAGMELVRLLTAGLDVRIEVTPDPERFAELNMGSETESLPPAFSEIRS